MRKHGLFTILLAIIFTGMNMNADAQRTVVIEGYAGTGDITPYIDAINNALDADAPNRVPGDDVTYILKRNQIYPNSKSIKNTFHMKLVAEAGEGVKPTILTWENSQGKYGSLLEAQADVYIENIQFDNRTPGGVVKSRCQNLSANGIRGVFKGCVVYQDDGAAFTIANNIDSCSIFLYDCFVHNCGTEGAYDSNGRFLDVRAGSYTDTVVIQNCTGDHLNGSFLRAGNSVIGYLKVDHITSFNSRAGDLSTQYPKTAIITNNLFKDAEMPGDVPSQADPAETNPDRIHNCVIDFDTIWPDANIVIRNNNVFWTQPVLEMWGRYDTIFQPLPVNRMALRALGDDSVHAFFSELVTLKTICDPPIAYMEGYILDPSATGYPSQHCVGGAGGYYPEEIDASYNTDSDSYTAGDDGYPVGDLNWFPELKARWENGEVLGVGKNMVTKLVNIYPNPANDQIFISSEVQGMLRLALYDILGKEVQSVLFEGGDARIDVSHLVKGMYIYRINNSEGSVQSGKLMISK